MNKCTTGRLPHEMKHSSILRLGLLEEKPSSILDINVTHVNAASYRHLNQEHAQILKNQESKEKRKYNQRVTEVEGGSFTPLVFGTNGAIGKECNTFISKLATKLSAKRNEYANFVNWIRTRYSTYKPFSHLSQES